MGTRMKNRSASQENCVYVEKREQLRQRLTKYSGIQGAKRK